MEWKKLNSSHSKVFTVFHIMFKGNYNKFYDHMASISRLMHYLLTKYI